MNQNVVKGKGKQIRGQLKVWWGKLSHNNTEKVGGKFDQLIGLLQEKVGQTQQQVQDESTKRKNVRL